MPKPPRGRHSGDVFAKVPTSVDVQQDFEPYISVEIAFQIPVIGLPEIGMAHLDEIYNFIRDEVLRKFLSFHGLPRRL